MLAHQLQGLVAEAIDATLVRLAVKDQVDRVQYKIISQTQSVLSDA
jgi:hypothetical protein